MLINMQGFGHFQDGLNNQDFGIENGNILLVLDGCSESKYSEGGARIFAQLFSTLDGFDELSKFEINVKTIFDKIILALTEIYKTPQSLQEFIMDNMLYTIIGCFETEDAYVVKIFGDGYIITKNIYNSISFIKLSYGKMPPYFAYKYCDLGYLKAFKDYDFKTFEFSKAKFKNVAIASDGVMPIAKGNIDKIEDFLFTNNKLAIENIIRSNRIMLYDDITIAYKVKEET